MNLIAYNPSSPSESDEFDENGIRKPLCRTGENTAIVFDSEEEHDTWILLRYPNDAPVPIEQEVTQEMVDEEMSR